MSFLTKITDLLGGGFIKKVGDVIDRFVTTPEERTKLKQALTAMHQAHIEQLHSLANADRNSARNLQIAALAQNDRFSKRFVYYLAGFWSLAGVVYVFLVTFTQVVHPRMADTVLGFLMGTIVSTIINYFYGSSNTIPNQPNATDDTLTLINHLRKQKKTL